MSLREPTAPALPSWVRTAAPVGVGILGLVAWVLYVDVAAAAPRMLPSPIAIAQEFVLRLSSRNPPTTTSSAPMNPAIAPYRRAGRSARARRAPSV